MPARSANLPSQQRQNRYFFDMAGGGEAGNGRAHRLCRFLAAFLIIAFFACAPTAVQADDFPGTAGNDVHREDETVATDTVSGADGDDALAGGGGNDTIDGGNNNDTLTGDVHSPGGGSPDDHDLNNEATTGSDAIDGGDGNDTIYGDGFDSGGKNWEATADSVNDVDTINGGDGDDTIWGDSFITAVPVGGTVNGGDDILHGGEGSDFLAGDGHVDSNGGGYTIVNGGDDTLFGDAGDDTLFGDGEASGPDATAELLGGNDVIHGGDDDDWIWGEGINSAYVPKGGDDTLFGDAGNDTINGQSGSDTIDGGTENDTLAGEAMGHFEDFDSRTPGYGDTLQGGSGNDTVFGDGSINASVVGAATLTGGNDTVDGGADSDNVMGDGVVSQGTHVTLDGGNDIVSGGDGDDSQLLGDGVASGSLAAILLGGDDHVSGGTGNDSLLGDGSADVDGAGAGDATLTGGADSLDGGMGNDGIQGDGVVQIGVGASSGNTLLQGAGDFIDGGGGEDGINGDGYIFHQTSVGDATLIGAADSIFGGDDADKLYGDGQVHMWNGTGTATLQGGDDFIDGGTGDDILVGDGWMNVGTNTKNFTGGADLLLGGAGNDVIYGEWGGLGAPPAPTLFGGDDTIYGGAGNDTAFGQSGNDQVFGEDGDDTLDGGSGNDFLCGGSGTNVVRGGEGADLNCAVDDAITVTSEGGTIDVSINEELADVDEEDRAGRRFEIVSISGRLRAVMDAETGKLTIFSAHSSGEIRYRVYLVDGGFETFASVFVALADVLSDVEEKRQPEEVEDPVVERDDSLDYLAAESLVDVPDAATPIDAQPQQPSPAPTSRTTAADGQGGFASMGEAVVDLMQSEFAPAAQVTMATTLMMAVTGGAGLASASLATSRPGSPGGSKGEAAPNKNDGTSDGTYVDFAKGEGAGDRSFTWRFPGHQWLDRLSVALPVAIAPHSPLLGRLAVDGSELRAIFGTLWFVMPGLGAIVGGLAAAAADGVALPPPLWILIAGAVITTFDALAGAIASTVYIVAGIAGGILWNPQSPDFVHSLLVYSGVAFLWTSIPLIGSAIRPFRRLGNGSFRYAWDVAADLSIAALLCAWVTRGLFGAMDKFAGQPIGLGEYANTAALVVLGCVALRVITEHLATRLYRKRLSSVETTEEFPDPTLFAALSGVAIRTGLFSFIGHAFIGACWQWWAGSLLYCIPQVLAALDARFDHNKIIQKLLPRGIVALFVILLAGAGVLKLATMHSQTALETMQWVFVLLAVPPLLLAVLERFTPEDDKKRRTGWTAEILGLGVVVASTWLAFHGWSL